MNFKFAGFLDGSLKILNIVNRTLPLVKEFNPTLGTIIKKYKNVTNKKSNEKLISLPNNSVNTNKEINLNKGLTFFK